MPGTGACVQYGQVLYRFFNFPSTFMLSMNPAISILDEFERRKNTKALFLTMAISGAILLIVFFVKWSIPEKQEVPPVDIVDIAVPDEPPVDDPNLGNNDVGSGDKQPIVTGTPSSQPVSQEVAEAPRGPVQQASRDFEEDNHSNSPVITKPPVSNTAKEITSNPNSQVAKASTPELKKGARMTSVRGSGNGGNTDVPGYDRPGSQGPGDGPGDKGVHNGNPNGTKYIGVRVVSIPNVSFEDDFKEGGKINLDVVVDENGKLVSASYRQSGSTLPKSSKQYTIAMDRARSVPYPKMDGGFRQTLTFNFTVR